MKLVVFGATGGIGSRVVEQALALGHEVTAVARRPSAITLRHECLTVIRGDVLDAATVQQPINGQDAVVSAIGVATNKVPTTVYSQGVANILQAMQVAHVRRLICVSASGLEPGPILQRIIAKPILWAILKNSYTDLVRMEAELRKSDLDWTIMRPPRLTNGPRTGRYHIAINKHLSRGSLISRADLADCILKQLENKAADRALIEVAY
jgi:putative NADH-flavin reductase